MDIAVDNIVLPQEAVGTGGKWEFKKGSWGSVERTTYEMVSIEKDRVNARTTHTASGSMQNAKGSAMTAAGSGEMTIHLARVVPEKGNVAYRVEGAGPDEPDGNKFTMKMRSELRIETK